MKKHVKAALTGGVIAISSSLSAGSELDHIKSLRLLAEAEGLVRIIVELKTQDVASESVVGEGAEMSKLMLQSALPMDDAPLVEFIEDQPLMVMEVTAKGLAFLNSSPYVARISLDGIEGVNPPIEGSIQELSPDDDSLPTHSGEGTGDLAAPQN